MQKGRPCELACLVKTKSCGMSVGGLLEGHGRLQRLLAEATGSQIEISCHFGRYGSARSSVQQY